MTNELQTVNTGSAVSVATGMEFDTSILAGTRSESTIRMYKRDFAAYAAFAGSFQMAMLPETLAQWRTYLVAEYTYTVKVSSVNEDGEKVVVDEERHYSPNTINRMLSSCKTLVSEAASQGYVSYDTNEEFQRVKGVKVHAMKDNLRKNAKVWLTPEQMQALTSAPDTDTLAGKMHSALLLTLGTVGARIAEIVNMKFSDIELMTKGDKLGYIVKIAGKNKVEATPRSIGVRAYNAICEWMAAREKETGIDTDYIFTGFSGRGSRGPRSTPIHTVSAWEIVKRYAKVAELDMLNVKPHDFRRFVAEQLGEKYGIKAAQTQLAHANIATTAMYMRDKPELGGTDDLF